jgi:hypothetical protein
MFTWSFLRGILEKKTVVAFWFSSLKEEIKKRTKFM